MDFCLNSHGGRRNFGNRCLPPRQQNPIIHGCSCHKNFTDFHLCEYSGFVILALGLLNTWILKWRQNQGWADERQKRSRWVRRSGTLSNELRSGKSGIWDDKEMKWEMEKWRNNIFCYLIIFIFILSIKAFIRGGFAKSIVKMEINEFYWKWIAKRLERGFLIRLMVEEEGIIDWLRKQIVSVEKYLNERKVSSLNKIKIWSIGKVSGCISQNEYLIVNSRWEFSHPKVFSVNYLSIWW